MQLSVLEVVLNEGQRLEGDGIYSIEDEVRNHVRGSGYRVLNIETISAGYFRVWLVIQ